MINYKDENFLIELKDGIIHVEWLKETYDYDSIDYIIKKRIEMVKGESYPIFTDLRKLKSGSRQARERLAGPDAGIGVTAVAVLVSTRVQRTLYNFFNAIYKAPVQAKIFTSKEKALEWLEKFK
jgi:hypothetical protein